MCNPDGHFTHSRTKGGGAEWEPREDKDAPWLWGLGVFSQMIFLAGEHRAGSGDQDGWFVVCGMRNPWFAVGMACKKLGQGSWISVFPAFPWICFHLLPLRACSSS